MTDHARRFDPKRLSAHSDPVNMSPEYVENPDENRHIEYGVQERNEWSGKWKTWFWSTSREFAEEYSQGDDHCRVVAREISEPWVVT